jgi:hypothetical protein
MEHSELGRVLSAVKKNPLTKITTKQSSFLKQLFRTIVMFAMPLGPLINPLSRERK